jgi:hypothetical protein
MSIRDIHEDTAGSTIRLSPGRSVFSHSISPEESVLAEVGQGINTAGCSMGNTRWTPTLALHRRGPLVLSYDGLGYSDHFIMVDRCCVVALALCLNHHMGSILVCSNNMSERANIELGDGKTALQIVQAQPHTATGGIFDLVCVL